MSEEYLGWAKRHATAFGMSSEQDALMLREWVAQLSGAGYTSVELHRATDWLVRHGAPGFRADHLRALVDRLREQRHVVHAWRPQESERGDCVLCFGAGLLSVPSTKAIQEGRQGTQAVACVCFEGRAFALKHLTLTVYERSFPRAQWQALLRQWQEENIRELRALYGKRKMPKEMEEILNRILERMRKKE